MKRLIFLNFIFLLCFKIVAQDSTALRGIWVKEGTFRINTLDERPAEASFLKLDIRENGLVYISFSYFERGVPRKYSLRNNKFLTIDSARYEIVSSKEVTYLISPDGHPIIKVPPEQNAANQNNILFDSDKNLYKSNSVLHPTLNLDFNFYDLLFRYQTKDLFLETVVPSWAGREKSDIKLTVKFIIDRTGQLHNVSIEGAVPEKKQNYINRILLTSGHWSPAKLNGLPVDSELTLHVERMGLETIEKLEMAELKFAKGVRLYDKGKFLDAATFITKALLLRPNEQRYLLVRAKAFFKLKNKQLACEDLQKITDYKLDLVEEMKKESCN
jgi:hypothetical protein